MTLRLLALFVLAPLFSLAQRQVIANQVYRDFGSVASSTIDTLGLVDFMETQTMLYASPNGGYVFGNNGYLDQAKAQTYFIDTLQGRYLRGVLVMFGGVEINSNNPDTSWIELLVYNRGGRAYTQVGNIDTLIGPDTSAIYAAIPISQINPNGYTYFDVSWQNQILKGDYYFAIRHTRLLSGDTLGIISSAHGEGGQQYRVWELNAFSEWVNVGNVTRSWGLDVNLAIFPVVDSNLNIGIAETKPRSPMVFPNPVTQGVVRVKNVTGGGYELMAPDGRKIRSGAIISNSIDLSGVESGAYLLRLSSPTQIFTQPLIIQ